ncbi:hypothetical protein HMI56_007704 [Coelomomyces lativittatus]|nr:hypothetical protein HMI56_007704 [Coelomomyces lativittatus]
MDRTFSKPLFGFSASRPAIFKKADPHVFYLDDEELDFDKVLSAPLPKLPLDVCLTAHWLAIEGVQPSIPQNPVPPTLQEEKKSLAAILNVNVPSSNSTSVPFSAGGTSVNGTYNNGSTLSTTSGTPGNTLQVKDVISKELQLYYEKITEAILNPEIEIRDVALTSIQTDPGLQGLLPYFLKFVQERVTKNLKHLPTLMLMITFLKHLLSNPHFFFEPYLHQVIPILLTTLMGKQLCLDPLHEDHWSLRQHSAHLLSTLLFQFSDSYPTLLPRVTRTFLMMLLEPSKPLTSKVGAVLGLSLLGPEVIEASLIPNVHLYIPLFESKGLQPTEDQEKRTPTDVLAPQQDDEENQSAIKKLLEVYAQALANYHHSKKDFMTLSKPVSPTLEMEIDEKEDPQEPKPSLKLKEEKTPEVTSMPPPSLDKDALIQRYGTVLGDSMFRLLLASTVSHAS